MNSSPRPTHPAESPGSTRLSLMAAVSIVVLVAHAPLLVSEAELMWGSDHYSFFPLILLGSAVLAWQRYRSFVGEQGKVIWDASFRSPLLWGASIVLLAVAVVAQTPWLAGIGFLFALRAAINSLFVQDLARQLMPAWWFLWLAIRLPLNFDRHLIISLQLLATKLASGVLDLGGIYHAVSGVVIELPGKSFFVEEACSGIQSLFAAVSVTIFYSLLGRRGLLRTLILSVCGMGWVLVANALRIISVTVFSTRYGLPIDEGWAHEATGAAVFVLALLLIVSTDRFLLFLAPLKDRSAFEKDRPSYFTRRFRRRRSGSPVWTIPAAATVACVFAFLAFVQFTRAVPIDDDALVLDRVENVVDESSLPAEWNRWEKTDYTVVHRSVDDPNGQISHVWQYQRSGQTVLFSLDGPFSRWHDLGLCYIAQGWTVDHEVDHPGGDGLGYGHSELTQENHEGRHAFVAFTAFNETGQRISPPPFFRVGVGMRFPDASVVVKRISDAVMQPAGETSRYGGMVYQTQAFVEAATLLTDAERTLITDLFQHLTGQLRTRFETASTPEGEG